MEHDVVDHQIWGCCPRLSNPSLFIQHSPVPGQFRSDLGAPNQKEEHAFVINQKLVQGALMLIATFLHWWHQLLPDAVGLLWDPRFQGSSRWLFGIRACKWNSKFILLSRNFKVLADSVENANHAARDATDCKIMSKNFNNYSLDDFEKPFEQYFPMDLLSYNSMLMDKNFPTT